MFPMQLMVVVDMLATISVLFASLLVIIYLLTKDAVRPWAVLILCSLILIFGIWWLHGSEARAAQTEREPGEGYEWPVVTIMDGDWRSASARLGDALRGIDRLEREIRGVGRGAHRAAPAEGGGRAARRRPPTRRRPLRRREGAAEGAPGPCAC